MALKKWLLIILTLILFWSCSVFATVKQWEVIVEESELTFTGTLNDAPTTGKFKTFSGLIYFDPENLAESEVNFTIDLSSVYTNYGEIAETLKTQEWLDIKRYPSATFIANKFKKMNATTYQGEGKLTLRGITMPMVVTFTQESYGNQQVKIKGQATFDRLSFGLGKKEFNTEDEIKNEVRVNFVITAKEKP